MMKPFGLKFCCDQDILYIPGINSFVWTLLSQEAPILLAVASPQQIQDSKALSWTTYLVPPTVFRRENDSFDYPQLAFGDNFLYLTANLGNPGGALIARLPLADIAARRTINANYVIVKDAAYICPAQLTGNKGWFGWMRTYSSLRIFSWRETSGAMDPSFDVAIATVPMEEYHSLTPDNDDWLPDTSKIGPDTALSTGVDANVARVKDALAKHVGTIALKQAMRDDRSVYKVTGGVTIPPDLEK